MKFTVQFSDRLHPDDPESSFQDVCDYVVCEGNVEKCGAEENNIIC